jgi:hypothetical protein
LPETNARLLEPAAPFLSGRDPAGCLWLADAGPADSAPRPISGLNRDLARRLHDLGRVRPRGLGTSRLAAAAGSAVAVSMRCDFGTASTPPRGPARRADDLLRRVCIAAGRFGGFPNRGSRNGIAQRRLLGLGLTSKRFRGPLRFVARVFLDKPQEGAVRLPIGAVVRCHEGLAVETEDALLHGQPLHLRLGGGEEGNPASAGGLLLGGCQFQSVESSDGWQRALDLTWREPAGDGLAWKFTKAGCQCSAERSLKDK